MDNTEHGRSPDGSGYSAEPGPISVVPAVPVSIPNAANAIAEKLDEARALIERGWCQGKPYDIVAGVKCVCSMAALADIAVGDHRFAAKAFLRKAISPKSHYIDLATWNDAPRRTQAEVIDAFKRAAELARGES